MRTPPITDNAADCQFQVETDDGVAYLRYRREDDRLVLLHTEVPVEAEGRGLGSALVRRALEEARRDGLRIVPLCPFVHGWIERHPEHRELVAEPE